MEERPRIQFTRTELLHLAASVLVLSVAFAFVLNSTSPLLSVERLQVPPILWAASFIAVSSGFVLHELAHKIVAQRYFHWAEFRGWFRGLLMSLLVAAGAGILFAAPGAVHIWGRVTPKENGIISLVGPATNFVLALLLLPFVLFMDISQGAGRILSVVCFVNALLAVFNLLPVWNLDGRKVLRWSKPAYAISMAACLGLYGFLWVAGLVP
ncbi:MAG: hypothetical protein ACPHID_02575 [Thermoplasmatota archaeon]